MKTKIVLASLAGALLAAFLVGLAFFAPRLFVSIGCSPDEVRPWAVAGFEERVTAAVPTPWPALSSLATELPAVTKATDSLSLLMPSGPEAPKTDWRSYERVEADSAMKAKLPHVAGGTLELLYWRYGDGPWLDPVKGSELTPQPVRRIESTEERAFTFILKTAGAARRFHGGSLFNRSTKVSLSSSSSWRNADAGSDEVRLNVRTWSRHRASLMLEVPVTYGVPEVKELRLADGAAVRFGGSAEVSYLGRGPGWIRSRFSAQSRGQTELTLKWDLPKSADSPGWAALHVEPKFLFPKLQARVSPGSEWGAIHGSSQPPLARSVPAAAQSIEIRYLPHAARVQFKLPLPLSQPDLKDLYGLEIGDVEFARSFRVTTALAELLQVDPSSVRKLGLHGLNYPIGLKDATAMDLVELLREELGAAVHLDSSRFVLADGIESPFARMKALMKELVRRMGL